MDGDGKVRMEENQDAGMHEKVYHQKIAYTRYSPGLTLLLLFFPF